MSNNAVKAAFEKQVVVLPLNIIVPQKEVTANHRNGDFYKQLAASLKHIGLIDPWWYTQEVPASIFFSKDTCVSKS